MPELGREQQLIVTGSLLMLAAVALSFALYWTASLMVPFVLSIMVSYLVAPLVDVLQVRLGAPRWAAILAAFVVIGVGWTLLVLMLWTSATGIADNADLYVERVGELATSALGLLEHVPRRYLPEEWEPGRLDPTAVLESIDLRPWLARVGAEAGNVIGFAATLVSNAVLVTLFAVYQISGRGPREHRDGMWGEIDDSVRRYLLTKVGTSAATGVLVGLILAVLGVDLAFVFGVLAFLLNFIPSIGSILATLLPVPLVLLQGDSMAWAALAILLPGTVQFVIGNVLEPKIMGDSLDLHPIAVLLTLIFWGLLWGPVGMLLATPLTAVMKIVMSRFETTRAVAELLAGRVGPRPSPAADPPQAAV
ncbi:MAG: AI-2E family transporter [Alphaproteobacteria bacterium]|nr:AI-2E family transporter [Alphaproteobacteria bacterium]